MPAWTQRSSLDDGMVGFSPPQIQVPHSGQNHRVTVRPPPVAGRSDDLSSIPERLKLFSGTTITTENALLVARWHSLQ